MSLCGKHFSLIRSHLPETFTHSLVHSYLPSDQSEPKYLNRPPSNSSTDGQCITNPQGCGTAPGMPCCVVVHTAGEDAVCRKLGPAGEYLMCNVYADEGPPSELDWLCAGCWFSGMLVLMLVLISVLMSVLVLVLTATVAYIHAVAVAAYRFLACVHTCGCLVCCPYILMALTNDVQEFKPPTTLLPSALLPSAVLQVTG